MFVRFCDVRSVREIRKQIYWAGMADREESRKEWGSTERKVMKSSISHSKFD